MKAGIDYIGICATFYCHDGQGNWLFHKRSKNCRDEQGVWDCGGGKLEFKEDPLSGALRELQEEYGCSGEIQEQLPSYSIVRDNDKFFSHWVSISYIILVDP